MRKTRWVKWGLCGLSVLAAILGAFSTPATAQPDLVAAIVPTQGLPDGSPVPFSVTLRNLGDTNSTSAAVLIAIDGNPTDPPLDFGPLAPGSSQTLNASFTLGCGAHTATALADPENLILEADEQNNGATAAVRVLPVPSFQWSLAHAPDGHTLSLDASGSVGCRPLAFEWTIAPGGVAVGEVVSRTVPGGTLQVTLTVTSTTDATLRASTTQAVAVNNIPPWVTASLPQSPLSTGSPSELVVNATDVDGTVESYSVDMGDGSPAVSLAAAAQHAYAMPGDYTIVVTVTDNLGAANESFLTHRVLNRPPTARISPAAAAGSVGAPVALNGLLSSDPETVAENLSFQWSFGDGSTGNGAAVDHAYASPGEFTVTLTVTDEHGRAANGTARVTVLSGTAPQGTGMDLPLIWVLLFAGATVASFAFARSSRFTRARRTPPAPRPGSVDPPARGASEDE